MRRCLILMACSFAGLPSAAQVPEPGVLALASSQPTLRPVDETPAGPDVKVAMLAAAAPAVEVTPPHGALRPDEARATPTPVSPAAPTKPASELIPDDGGIRDTLNSFPAKPAPDAAEKTLACFQQVDYLRKHNDGAMAISYLKQVVTNKNLLPQDRARAILELSDILSSEHQEAESLCWLKIWMQLFPSRPEFGAVAYRVGTMYTRMGLPNLARDAYYLTLAHTVNDGQVQSAEDLRQYTRLTVGTLWALAANEYQAGQWARAAELFSRYRIEATTGSAASLEKAAFLQADCYYQLKLTDKSMSLYEETLSKHPFNALAPEARLRLYHLYVLKNKPDKAQQELQALAWTVRTVWPKQETYWQKQTAQLLLALNQKNAEVLPPLFQQSSKLSPEGKSWQDALNHYDALVSYQAVTTQGNMDNDVNSSGKADGRHRLQEEDELLAMNRTLNQLLPPPWTASNP